MTALARPYAEIIGDPVDKLLSPTVHRFWLEQLGMTADYRPHRLKRGELAAYFNERRRDPDWRGCNVAMPLKLDALSLADEASDRALGTGAANIILSRDGRLRAGNTDVAAVQRCLAPLIAAGSPDGLIILLGSGGAARAALMALRLLGVSSVRILSRDLAEATALAVQFRLHEQPQPFDSPITGTGLINATPLGMAGAPSLDADIGQLSENGWVLDFVTTPNPTGLLRRAAQRGLTTLDGIAVLVEQASESFSLFFGADAPRDRDKRLLKELRP